MNVIEFIVVPRARQIKLTVEMPDPDRFLTSHAPHLPRSLFRIFPRLAKHKCENELGLSFREECRHTEIPHLFEHLILEIQSQVQPAEVLRGVTEWNWTVDPRGLFHVTVDFENELLAVGAVRLAEKLMHAIDCRELDSLNLEDEMCRLRDLAQIGRDLTGVRNNPGDRMQPSGVTPRRSNAHAGSRAVRASRSRLRLSTEPLSPAIA